MAGCALALQLVQPADPVLEWYDAEDRRHIARSNQAMALRVDALGSRHCLNGSDFSCIVLLRKFPQSELPPPMSVLPRAALARYAVSRGGPGAVERMLEGEREPMQRLGAAAKLPPDTLLSHWRQAVHDTLAPSRDLSFEVVWVAVIWSVGLGVLSLRSSRWR